jgi:PAS domain S-box-containing protein
MPTKAKRVVKKATKRIQRSVSATPPIDLAKMAPEDVQRLVAELQVRQSELQVQNDQLRHAQIELAESRDRYSVLYDFAPVGYVTLDRDGTILESNRTAGTMLGVERPSCLLGSSLSTFVSSESVGVWNLHRRRAFSSDTKPVCEIGMRRANGTRLVVRMEGILFGPEEDRRCRTALIDITERKHAEAALNELNKTLEQRVERQTAEMRLQAEAIAHLSEGVLISLGTDWLDSTIVFVNNAACRITGYTALELLGRPRRILQGKLTSRASLNGIRRELSAGNSCHVELVQYGKGARPYDAEISITALPESGRRRNTYVSIHRDITEQKRAEQTLRESEQRFRQMGDHAPVMIWISGADRLCTWVNRPWLEFTGRTIEQELGNGWTEGIHREDLTRYLETYVTSFDRRVPFTMEYRVRRHDGQWRWILGNGVPLRKENGTFTGYIGSCVDVTDRKQTEHELEQYRNDLKKVSAELMLAEERERQRLAEDVHDGLGQALFRARMKLDQFAIADPRAKEVGTILEEMAGMMNTMTFELSPPVLRKLGFRAAVKWLAKDMQQRYALVVQIDGGGRDIPIDEPVAMILFRSVREVLINVAKHAQTNHANVSIRRHDRTVQIEVQDHGKGFNVADQSRHVESGHFGLFSVRERMEYVGGTFMIESAPGAGARVILTAPLAATGATRSVRQHG